MTFSVGTAYVITTHAKEFQMPYADRRAEPGAEIKSQTRLGESVKLKADDQGVVKIHNADQEEVADFLQLPVEAKAKTKEEG
jgi:hypothetical protein